MTQENTSAIENQNPSAPVAEGAVAATETTVQPPAEDFLQTDETTKKDAISGNEKLFAALGYLPFTGFVPLVLGKDSAFCQAHAKHGIVISALFGLLAFPAFIVSAYGFFFFLYGIMALFGAFLAYSGKMPSIPMVSDMAKKMKF